MANYEFEIIMAMSDLIDIEADSEHEAMGLARERAEEYTALVPDGYSMPWDNIDVMLISSDEEY